MDTRISSPICRACLKPDAKTNIFTVHKPTSLPYSDIFTSCITIQVHPEDDLPKQICRTCWNTVLKFYTFRNKVLENDLRLRGILKKETSPIPTSNVTTNQTVVKNEIVDVKLTQTLSEYIEQDENTVEAYQDIEAKPVQRTREKVHQCDVCGKILHNRSNLNQHYRKHTGERPYGCNVCSKTFRRSAHLVVHKRTHTGERPHQCSSCHKTFNQYAGLVAHKRIHSGECPFVCSVCGKSFSHSSSLMYHKRIHANETPFPCEVCQKSFRNAAYLKLWEVIAASSASVSSKMEPVVELKKLTEDETPDDAATAVAERKNIICKGCTKVCDKNIFASDKPSSIYFSYIFKSCFSHPDGGGDSSTQICQKCLNTILRFYIFKYKVLQNDLRLRHILRLRRSLRAQQDQDT
ncbi:hypothetical protein NQ315_000169 [Exocentrus adspersus]|uniref:Uncharacterized protein n=1 Tax=Exocentrus adspersus TaxID=1586481 RepID=A0AAV8VR93_9CUCU|nr:hypothetical protein NQ315_000169 [Exocentrus adspersus]